MLLFSSILFANDNYELKLYEKVLPAIFQTNSIVIYPDSDAKALLQKSSFFKLTANCADADLLVGKDFENLKLSCQTVPLFATSYNAFKNLNNSFGAFYWRKGRPQIKFNLDKMKSFHLHMPDSLIKYAK